MKLAEIQSRLVEIADEMEAISNIATEETRELSDADNDHILALSAEFEGLEASRDKAEKVKAKMAAIAEARATAQEPQAGVQPLVEETHGEKPEAMKIPATAKYNKSNVFASSEDAYTAGMFLAAMSGDRKASEFMAAQSVGTDDKGGFSVPTPLSSELISLVEDYGVARAACRRVVMGAMTWSVPKLTGHATIYYPAEAGSITESDLTFAQVSLTAKKMAGLVKMSTEISEDSIISMTDTIVRDLAWSFAKAEDDNLFTGGSILTGGIEGDADVADTNVASVAALALTDLTDVTVAAGQEKGLSHKWYMNATLFNGQIRDLLNAAGGNMDSNIQSGVSPTLLGYPVEFVSAVPGASAVSGDLLAVFGDMGVSHYFGDRRALNFNVLNELFAVNDQVGIICTQRIDIASVNPEVLSKLTVT